MRPRIFSIALSLIPLLGGPGGSRARAQDLVISEFMASNHGTLADDDGDHPDWIEIYNAGAEAVGLEGWYLTDDPQDLAKWAFPAVEIEAGGFLLVFASDKDRRDPGGVLHANFKLASGGEYLALVAPDGATPVWEYAPFPPQVADISYGLAQNGRLIHLVPSNAPARTLIPADGGVDSVWARPGFDDSEWMAGETGVGYDRNPTYRGLIRTDVRSQMEGVRTTAYIRIPFHVEEDAPIDRLELRVKYDDGFIAYINGARVAEGNAPASPRWDSDATALHDDSDAVVFETFSVPGAASRIAPGENVLAIHGLNDNLGSSDFLILPELDGFGSGELDREVRLYFPEPSPGWGNVQGYPGVAGTPRIEPPGMVFTGSLPVTLEVDDAETVIRYTLDGSEPTEGSPAYASPIVLRQSAMVRARGFARDLAPSPTVSVGYIALAADLDDFTSDLPLVIVDNFGAGGVPANAYQQAFLAIFEPVDGWSALTNPPHLETRAGLKVRGSSTAGRPKKTYAVEAWDERNDDKDIAPLGMPSDSDWILYGPYNFDRALIRNAFIYELSNEVGRYAVRCRFVEAFINTNGGALSRADYFGVYVFMEKIKRGEHRVDVEALSADAAGEPEIAGGYMLKIDRLDPGDSGFRAGGQRLAYVYPKEANITPAQAAWIKGYIDDFAAALNGPNFRDADVGYAAYIDIDSWIDHHILNVLAKNVDALRLSTFLFKRREGKLEMGPIWDFDRSMDSTDGRDDDPRTWNGTGDGTKYFDYPWWNRLFDDPDFWQRWKDRWHELRRGPLSTRNMGAVIDGMAGELLDAQVRNFQKWPLISPGRWPSEIDHLKRWLADRAAWIDGQFVPAPELSEDGGPIDPGFELSISAPAGTIYYTIDGSDPRLPGGGISPEAEDYAGPLRLDGNARVVARARRSSTEWSAPAAATFFVELPRLVITEIMFHPADPPAESPYDADDFEFVELRNIGTEPIDLAGFRLTGGIDFTFAGGGAAVLEPGRYVVVVKSLEAFAERYDAADLRIAGEYEGNLSNAGERLGLEGPLGEPILLFDYSDDWYPTTDGDGDSLVILDPAAPLSSWGEEGSWKPSAVPGGTPGREDRGAGGWQLPGDINQDGRLDIGDSIGLLGHLFGGEAPAPPCGGAPIDRDGNLVLADLNGDGQLDIGDAVYGLAFLFAKGPPPALGTDCVWIEGCPDACSP